MQTLNNPEIQTNRRALLTAIEQFVTGEYSGLNARNVNKADFHYYAGFFNPAVFDLVAWEQITRSEVKNMPGLRNYFIAATEAASATRLNYGIRDKEYDKGNPRRKFEQIATAELAANILPRLENILNCWGIYPADD